MHSTRDTRLYTRRYVTIHPYVFTDTCNSAFGSHSSSTRPSAPRTTPPTRRRRRRRQDETLPLRLRNAFILFRSHYYRTVAQSNARSASPSASDHLYVSIRQNDLSSEAAEVWKAMTELEKAPFREEAYKLEEEYRIALDKARNLQKNRHLVGASQSSVPPSASVSPAPAFSLPIENFSSVPPPQYTEDSSSTPFDAVWRFAGASFPSEYTFGSAQDHMLYPDMHMPQVSDEQVYTDLCTTYFQSCPPSPSAHTSTPDLDITLATFPNTNDQLFPLSDYEAAVLGVAPSYIACEDVQPGFGMEYPSLFPFFGSSMALPVTFGWENLFGSDVESDCNNMVTDL